MPGPSQISFQLFFEPPPPPSMVCLHTALGSLTFVCVIVFLLGNKVVYGVTHRPCPILSMFCCIMLFSDFTTLKLVQNYHGTFYLHKYRQILLKYEIF